jgi:hypothetical protein
MAAMAAMAASPIYRHGRARQLALTGIEARETGLVGLGRVLSALRVLEVS